MTQDYWRLLLIVSVAGLMGLIVGHAIAFMFLASFFYAIWLLRAWLQLRHWLQKTKKRRSPSAKGVIDEVCREIELVRKQNKSRKNKLGGYLKRFRSATAALPDAIVILGEYGQVDWANGSARQLLGIHWPRDSNVRVNNLIRDPDFQSLISSRDKDRTVLIESPANPAIQLEVKVVDYTGNGRMLIARDFTEHLRLQKMRRDFVANVSHELRTPLTVLRGYLEMFSNDDSTHDQWVEALPAMQQQTERMSDMLQELLALSRLETGEKELRISPVNIALLLAEIVDDAKQLKQYDDHQLVVNIESEKWLNGDSEEIRRAISNLVFNAVKYTPAGCLIEVNWLLTEKAACIEVSDQGYGIAEHHLDRLTERFYRVDRGRSQDEGGTGLGLAIVKHVLQRHDADLRIDSKIGSGTHFYCEFPLLRAIDKPAV